MKAQLSRRLHKNDIREIIRSMAEKHTEPAMLYRLLYDEDKRVSDNAAWVLTHLNPSETQWLPDKREELTDKAMHTGSETQRRLLLTLLLRCPSSEENLRTDFLDFCLTHMYSTKEPTSIKCLYMKLAYEQCKLFPELASELRKALELMENDLPAGMKSTRKNILRQLGSDY